ncbi:MAG: tetratricopeptide repeat protein, partial [Bacteroidales bacterium]|nr:tetratricopeptide repeat protein [Bacteroidales bacterium]
VISEEPINYFAVYESYCIARDMDKTGKERYYEEFVKLISDRDQCYLELAGIYINSGLYQEAIDLLEKFIAHREKGYKETTVGRRPERYLSEPDQISPMFYYYLGYLYGKIGQDKKAEEYFRIPLTLKNWNLVFPNHLEEFFILEQAIKVVPEDYLANYALGNILGGRYRFSDAITQWKTALEKMSSQSDEEKNKRSDVLKVLYVNIGSVLWKIENKPDEAIPYLEKSIEYAGWHFQPYHDLASLYMEEKEINKAIKVAEDGATKVRDGWFLVRDILVPLYYKQENYDRIIELLHNHWGGHIFRATFQDYYRQAHLAKGKKLFREGEFEQALKVFDSGTEYPDILLLNENDEGSQAFAELLWWKGLTLEELGKKGEAFIAWEKAVVKPYNTYSRGNIFKAKSLMRLGKKSEAEKLMSEIIFACEEKSQIITEYSSEVWFAYLDYLQAEVYEALGDIGKAKEFYQQAINEDPAHTEPVYTDSVEKLKEIEKK